MGLAVGGPMARSAADRALALDVLAGPDESEAAAYRVVLPPARHGELRSHRVLVVDSHPLGPVQPAVRDALHRLADRLAAAGAAVSRASPLLPDLAETTRLRESMAGSLGTFGRCPEALQAIRDRVAALPPGDDSLFAVRLRGAVMTTNQWRAAEIQRAQLRVRWRALFREFDVVLCPPFWSLAPAHGEYDWQGDWLDRRIEFQGRSYAYTELNIWMTMATVIGLPATVAPIGRAEAGLPVGVQIIGPFLEDRTPIAFAGLIEREFGGFASAPGMDG
jgi:amidase